MKMINKLIYTFLAAVVLVSCNQDAEIFTQTPPDFIHFSGSSSVTIFENGGSVELGILTSSSKGADATISVTSADATEDVDYTVSTKTVAIGADEYETTITVTIIDNFEEDGNKTLVVSLDSDLTLGANSAVTINISDNDCAYDYSLIDGVIAGTDGSWQFATSDPYPSVANFTYISDTEITVEDLGVPWMNDWWGEVVTTYYPITLTIDESGSVITMSEGTLMETTYNGAPQEAYTVAGSGTISTCDGTMTLLYEMCNYGTCWNSAYASYNNDGGTMFKAVFQLPSAD